MSVYYNEYDQNAAAWLRQLIAMKLIADGVVDDRSITEVEPADLQGVQSVSLFRRNRWMAYTNGEQRKQGLQQMEGEQTKWTWCGSINSNVAYSINERSQGRLSGRTDSQRESINRHSGCSSTASGMGNTEMPKLQNASNTRRWEYGSANTSNLEWQKPDWIYFRDGKYRPIKPGIKPLVDGVSERMVRSSDLSAQINADETKEARVMRLKGYGNAIVPQVAAQFIMEHQL